MVAPVNARKQVVRSLVVEAIREPQPQVRGTTVISCVSHLSHSPIGFQFISVRTAPRRRRQSFIRFFIVRCRNEVLFALRLLGLSVKTFMLDVRHLRKNVKYAAVYEVPTRQQRQCAVSASFRPNNAAAVLGGSLTG